MKLSKTKTLVLLISMTTGFVLPGLSITRVSAETPPACEGLSGEKAIEACAQRVQRDIDDKCSGLANPTQIDQCAESIRNNPNTAEQENKNNFSGDCMDSSNLNEGNCGIISAILTLTNVLSAVAVIVITGMVVVGGVQYSASRDNPQAVQAAKSRITNAVIALVVYIFFYAFLQYIIPGGLL